MRGFLQPALRPTATETQTKFTTLSRARRVKLARAAQTTLIKADQWARGEVVAAEIGTALEGAVKSLKSK